MTMGRPLPDAPGVPGTARAIQEGGAEPVREDESPSNKDDKGPGIRFVQPFDGAVYPRDIAPPLFQWRVAGVPAAAADRWEVAIHFAGGREPVRTAVRTPEWRPDAATWAVIKRESLGRPARLVVSGHRTLAPRQTLGEATATFSTSPDAVEAPIFYRDVNLPFIEAVKDPSDIRWRFGSVASENPPPVVLDRMPVCGNCHSFSSDGRVFGMDVDYANSKGSYVVTATAPEIALAPRDIITWDEFRREDGELTFGLLSQVSPDGRWVVSTVKDKSVFVPRPGVAFSQLFFPVKGILALYHRESGRFRPLPGADDPAFVQSNPAWSPDGRYVVFARAPAHDLSHTAGQGKVLLTPEECREYAQEGRPFRFDLFRLAFNDGEGGQAEPLEGASGDGRSNFFPKHSPDGRWIIFCKASNYMLLQPDSELYIIPAGGGPARRLHGNTSRMNSWHSWSPNGRWLVFSSKALSDYTQLFLTHISPDGESAVPVLLDRFTSPRRAANIPEFVNLPADGIVKIRESFLNDYSFERAGNEFYRGGEPDRAIQKYRQALALNPTNVTAHQRLGFLLYHVQRQLTAGLGHTTEALRLDPRNSRAHCDLGVALLQQGRAAEAIPHLRSALEVLPPDAEAQYQPQAIRSLLGKACLQLNRFPEASTEFREALRLDADQAESHYLLALALACQGNIEDTVRHRERAVALRPEVDTSVVLHELLAENYARVGRLDQAMASARHALELARAAGKQDLAGRIAARLARYEAAAAGGAGGTETPRPQTPRPQ